MNTFLNYIIYISMMLKSSNPTNLNSNPIQTEPENILSTPSLELDL
jgi:hypothetical protein